MKARDGDGDTLRYILEGPDADRFSIDSTTGQLRTIEGVVHDYEIWESYNVTVRVVDGQCGSDIIDVTIDLTDVQEPPASTGLVVAGPTAWFSHVPSGHDGSTPFRFRLYFSEKVDLSYRDFSRGLFETSAGRVRNARRLVPPSNRSWEIDVVPDGEGAMVISLPGNRACDTDGAVCNPDGDQLAYTVVTVILGPVPSVTSAALTAAEDTTVITTLAASDGDTIAEDLTWSILGGDSGGADASEFAITPAGVLSFTTEKDFENPDDANVDGTYEVTVQVSDGALTDTADLQVTLTDVNEAPTADAGDDQDDVAQGVTVTLEGTGTDPDAGDTLAYAWAQTGGDSVTPSAPGTATTTFDTPSGLTANATLTFTLTVTDSGGLSHRDEVSVTVAAQAPASTTTLSDDASISALSLSGLSLSPAFASGTETYAVDAPVNVTVSTVSATTTGDGTTVTITPSDADDTADNGHQVSLDYGENTIAVLVTAEDGVATTSYTVTVDRARRWSATRANEWGDSNGWLVGANYIPRYAINQLEHWQADTFDIDVIDEELGWSADLGMNVMRVFLHDLLYKQDSTGFLDRIEQYLVVADKHGLATILVFFDDVWNPNSHLGTQPTPTPGVHNSGWVQSPGRTILGDLAAHDSLEPYLKGVIARFDGDERVIAFELYNEPGHPNKGTYGVAGQNVELADKSSYSQALLEKAFHWAREIGPAQPVFASLYSQTTFRGLDAGNSSDRFSARHSDIIGFHSYMEIGLFRGSVELLTDTSDRPVVVTEYLARGRNTFELMLPILQEHGVGAINWGLVDGKSQTKYDWKTWQDPEPWEPYPWFHDILRPSCVPYDPDEVALIRQLTGTTSKNEMPTFDEGAEALRSLVENTGADRNVGAPVKARDGDGDTLRYILEGPDADRFSIDSTTGQLRTIEGVVHDYEVWGSYKVMVRVVDGRCGSDIIDVTIDLIDVQEPPASTGLVVAGPTAWFSHVPSGHDGSTPFRFRLYFSEEVVLSYRDFSRGLLFRIRRGRVLNGHRQAPPSSRSWEVDVVPDGEGAMIITLPAGRACDTDGAVCTRDGQRLSVTVSVTVPGPAPSVTSASVLTVNEGTTAIATLAAVDADTQVSDLTWSIPSGTGGGTDAAKFQITPAGALSFTTEKDFENPDDANGDGTYEVTVEVSDGERTDTADLQVALSDVNEAPTADAGDDQDDVAQGVTVTLEGTGTDPDAGDTLSYAWAQTSGDTVTPSAPGTATTTFDTPSGLTANATLTFSLTVTDSGGLSHRDEVSVTVMGGIPGAPTATVAVGTSPVTEGTSASFTIRLDRTASTSLSVVVSVTDDSGVLSGPATTSVAFDAGDNTRNITLATWDDDVIGATSTVTLSLGAGNGYTLGTTTSASVYVTDNDTATWTISADPAEIAGSGTSTITVAIANGKTFAVDRAINLAVTGTASSSDYSLLATTLTLAAGASSTSATVVAGDIVAEGDETVIVTATREGQTVGTTTVTLMGPDRPNITGTSTFEVPEGATIVATLTAEDADNGAEDLTWSIPFGNAVSTDAGRFTITPAGALSFTAAKDFEEPDDANTDGVYEVTVRVSDGTQYDTADLQVTLTDVNEAPTANAGPDQSSVEQGSTVTLSGSASDPDAGKTLSYAWRQASGDAVTLSATGTATTTFTAPTGMTAEETLRFVLRVTDDGGLFNEDKVSITVVGGEPALTAWFEQMQSVHNGSAHFTFRLYFSKDIDISYRDFTGSVFEVTGGTVQRSRRLVQFSDIGWEIPIIPDGNGDVVITLPGKRACDVEGAICTSDGERLSATISATVSGPASDAPPVATIAAGKTPIVEGTTASFTVTLDTSASTALSLPVSVADGNGVLSDAATTSVAFDVGEHTRTLNLVTWDDDVIRTTDSSVTVSLGTGSGFTLSTTTTATVSVTDNDSATWAVTAQPTALAEGGTSTITVAISNKRTFADDQTISLVVTGTASSSDYSLSTTHTTLASGATSTATTVTATDDDLVEGGETVTVTAKHDGQTVGSTSFTIEASDTPLSSDATLSSLHLTGIDIGAFSSVNTSYSAGVEYDVSSTTATVEPNGVGASVVISDATGSTQRTSRPVSLAVGANHITVTVTAEDGSTTKVYNVTVTRAEQVAAPVATIVSGTSPVTEGTAASFTISLDRAASTSLSVFVGFTDEDGVLSSAATTSVVFDAGASTRTISLSTIDDNVIEATSIVTASLRTGSGYSLGTTTSASVSVIDDDSATWMVSADPEETTEGGSATITVSVANGKTFSDDRSVSLVVTGSATSSDYSLTGTQITLVAGSTSTTASVSAIDDDMVESDETVIVTATDDGQTIGSVTITIEANDSPTWTVSAQPDEIAEGGTSTVTVAVSNNRTFAADQTISLAVEGTAASSDYSLSGTQIILAAGATSITASVSATDDVIAEGAETVTLKATHDGQTLGSATVTISASDIPLSTDATLSSLALSGADFGTFSSAVVDYSTSVEYAVSATTVTAEASDDGASVSIADADGSTLGTSRTISLSLGNNEITVTVTAEDGTTGVYAVIVTRAEPDTVWGERLPDRDIEVGSGAQPSGLWSDGTTMWIITDPAAGRISVYSLADGAEQAERGFTLAGGAAFASALWSDGTTLWVADLTAGRVRAYSLSDGTRRAGQDLDTGTLYSAGNGLPSGLWSDGATMWVADYGAMRVFAYDLTTSARQAPREFDLYKRSGESYNPYGIWSNGDTLLVSNWIGGEVVVHYLSDGQRRPELDISTLPSRTSLVTGIWSDGQVLWVSDNDNVGVAIYAYAVPGLGSTQ